MIKTEENIIINENLKKLYKTHTKEYLRMWSNHFYKKSGCQCRLNEFGIIDPEKFDAEKRILVIGKETRNWDYSYEKTFREWLYYLSSPSADLKGKDGTKYPRMWYNIGKWAKLICNPELQIKDNFKNLSNEKKDALEGLSYIAFTNINKVNGGSSSGESYRYLSEDSLAISLIIQEIELLKPNYIILCDKKFKEKLFDKQYKDNTALKKCIENKRVYIMPHPAARKSNLKMLEELKSQL